MTRKEKIKEAAWTHDDLGRRFLDTSFIRGAEWADSNRMVLEDILQPIVMSQNQIDNLNLDIDSYLTRSEKK